MKFQTKIECLCADSMFEKKLLICLTISFCINSLKIKNDKNLLFTMIIIRKLKVSLHQMKYFIRSCLVKNIFTCESIVSNAMLVKVLLAT